jgi:hypothetical protein
MRHVASCDGCGVGSSRHIAAQYSLRRGQSALYGGIVYAGARPPYPHRPIHPQTVGLSIRNLTISAARPQPRRSQAMTVSRDTACHALW